MQLLTEKYRPTKIEEYIFRDNAFKQKIEQFIAQASIPNLLLTGVPGVGKTTLARLLIRELGIPNEDMLELNASKERGIDSLQDRIAGFVSTWAMNETGIKYIILDEADSLSPLAQKMLRNSIETYSDICRFIFTANHPQKISPAIHSRLQMFQFETLDRDDFITRLGEILTLEGVEFTIEQLLEFVDLSYPDMRKAINTVDQNIVGGRLLSPKQEDLYSDKEYLIETVRLFEKGKTTEARKLLVASAQTEDYPDIFRYFYQNLHLWGDTEDKRDRALLLIRNGLVSHSLVADVEINLSATLVELAMLKNS